MLVVMTGLEVTGIITMMLTGAMPLIHVVNKYAFRHLATLRKYSGVETDAGVIGLFGSMANSVIMFSLLHGMSPADKVTNVAFAVSGAFVFADHLAYGAIYQPSMLGIVIVGKIAGGLAAVIFARYCVLPYLDYFVGVELVDTTHGLLVSAKGRDSPHDDVDVDDVDDDHDSDLDHEEHDTEEYLRSRGHSHSGSRSYSLSKNGNRSRSSTLFSEGLGGEGTISRATNLMTNVSSVYSDAVLRNQQQVAGDDDVAASSLVTDHYSNTIDSTMTASGVNCRGGTIISANDYYAMVMAAPKTGNNEGDMMVGENML
jgi:hypothetical protein